MSVALNSKGVEAARAACLAAMRKNEGPSSVVDAVLTAYVGAVGARLRGPAPVRRQASLSPMSRTLAALAVGEAADLPGVNASNLSRYFDTARRLLGNPDARWTARTMPDRTVRVRRNPDGFSGRDPTRNRVAVELAAMKVGESKLTAISGANAKGGSWQNAKFRARMILNDQRAEWSRRVTSKGLRVTRLDPDLLVHVVNGFRAPPAVQRLASEVCNAHGVAISEVMGGRRTKDLVTARHDLIRRIHEIQRGGEPRYHPSDIAEMVGRDRTTVLYVLGLSAAGRTQAKGRHAA